MTRNNWQDEMIKRGVAHYNWQTGKWEWGGVAERIEILNARRLLGVKRKTPSHEAAGWGKLVMSSPASHLLAGSWAAVGKWNHKARMTLLLRAGLDFDQFAIKNDRHCDEARRIAVNIAKLPELSRK